MSEKYTDNKIETKATDSSSGSYAPPVEKVQQKKLLNRNYTMPKVTGLNGFLAKMLK